MRTTLYITRDDLRAPSKDKSIFELTIHDLNSECIRASETATRVEFQESGITNILKDRFGSRAIVGQSGFSVSKKPIS
jgi:hypothetical protein